MHPALRPRAQRAFRKNHLLRWKPGCRAVARLERTPAVQQLLSEPHIEIRRWRLSANQPKPAFLRQSTRDAGHFRGAASLPSSSQHCAVYSTMLCTDCTHAHTVSSCSCGAGTHRQARRLAIAGIKAAAAVLRLRCVDCTTYKHRCQASMSLSSSLLSRLFQRTVKR